MEELLMKLEAYKMAAQTRNMEIGLFWQRSNYFLVLNTAVAAGFFSLQDKSGYALLLSLTGLVAACLWVAVNLGSKFWQSRWETRLRKTENEWNPDLKLFSADWETVQQDVRESFSFRKRGPIHSLYQSCVMLKPSVTMMMTGLSVTFVVFWIVAAVATLLAG